MRRLATSEAGELAASSDARALALHLHSFEIGLSTQARDDASGEEFDAAVSSAMLACDANAV